MPAGKRSQNNASIIALIIFISLFLIATVAAVVLYNMYEKQRTLSETLRAERQDLATDAQMRKIGSLVGTKEGGETRLQTLLDYIDTLYVLSAGGVPGDTSAEVKVENATKTYNETVDMVSPAYISLDSIDPNSTGLAIITEKLKNQLDMLNSEHMTLQDRFSELEKRFDNSVEEQAAKEQAMLAEKEKLEQQVDTARQAYEELKELVEQTSDQRVNTLMTKYEQEQEKTQQLNQQLMRTRAELTTAQSRMKEALADLQNIVPAPDKDVAAFKPDGKIILLDDALKIVHINLGSEDGVYRGLTFSVYDKNIPIPKDGKGKAEIEVFNVGKTISAARIIRSEIKRPVVLDDAVANLVWDADQTNVFAVAGQFDVDGDGTTDFDGDTKIAALIEKWGGKVVDEVTVDTDYVVLGREPVVLSKPTLEQLQVDPMATQKYEASIRKREHYNTVIEQAETLWIPVFDVERFLYFIGYKELAKQPGAF